MTSTILSLIAVPWAYVIIDDLRNYFMKITALFLWKGKTEVQIEKGSAGGGAQ